MFGELITCSGSARLIRRLTCTDRSDFVSPAREGHRMPEHELPTRSESGKVKEAKVCIVLLSLVVNQGSFDCFS